MGVIKVNNNDKKFRCPKAVRTFRKLNSSKDIPNLKKKFTQVPPLNATIVKEQMRGSFVTP